MAAKVRHTWHGKRLKARMESAVNKAAVIWGESVTSNMKVHAHKDMGTLSRSIHAAPPKYDGSSDESLAIASEVPNAGPIPSWNTAHSRASVAAGSWISYAIFERARGGTHEWMDGPVNLGRIGFPLFLTRAFRSVRF